MLKLFRRFYQQISQRTYLLLWLVVGLLGLVTIYIRVKIIFLVNPDIGGIESNVIFSVLRMMAGYPLYQNPEQAPYAITQYSPIYYYLTAGLSRLLGFTSDDVYEVYSAGRCLALLANGFYAWGLWKLARRIQLPASVAALVAILAFLLLPPQSYGRPDSLYNVFVIWTIWALVRWNASTTTKKLTSDMVLTALLAALGLFSKQSAICLAIIVSGYLLFFSGKPRKAYPFLGFFLLFVGVLYVSFFREAPDLIYANVIRGVSNGIDFVNFRYNLVDHYLRPFSWLVVPGVAISIRYLLFEKGPRQLIGLATFGLFLFALVTGLKWGSALNYFTEFTGLSCILVADALWQLRTLRSDWANVGRLGLLMIVALVVPVNAMNFNWERVLSKPIDLTPYKEEQAVAQYVATEMKKYPGCLIYSTQYNSSYLNAFLFRHCIVPQQDMIIGSAYELRTYDYTDLEQAAKDGRIKFLIARNGETEAPLSPPIHLANYHPVKSLNGYVIYKFNASNNQLSAK
ncbi:glycosyltransferase family 39 protein [Spirosoma jeollabukense]